MAVNLPASPTAGQSILTSDGTVYQFDGVRWVRVRIDTSIDALVDVDTTTQAPQMNNILRYDGANWVPHSAAANFNTVNGIASGGNVVWTDGKYQYHEFRQDSVDMPFDVTVTINADILIVGGGGGGGSHIGGGGGGGGVALLHGITLAAGSSHTVHVGGYGTGGAGDPITPLYEGRQGNVGLPSRFNAWVAEGGGGGGHGAANVPKIPYSGASGGGAGRFTTAGGPGVSTLAMGNVGGASAASGVNAAGGGGGAGGPGQDAIALSAGPKGGNGGVGVSVWGYQVGGGGGGGVLEDTAGRVPGVGATAFGGGSCLFGSAAQAGRPNTGGGGGGGAALTSGTTRAGGDGGTGIVVVRYPI